ncbi:MAG TPA: hypothetical protein VK506_05205 [Conexibacter sp.]|nr:hypothetical protein [Conexibacter sp.]
MADIDRINAGEESRYGPKASFVGSDLVTDEMIRESHDKGLTVVIVDEHENVRVLPAPDPSVGERERDRFWREILAHW